MSKREAIVKHVTLTKFYDSFLAKTYRFEAFALLFLVSALSLTGCGAGIVSSDEGAQTDPVVVDSPVAFVKRPLLTMEGDIQGDDLAEPQIFRPGAALYIKSRATLSADAKDITSSVFSDETFLNEDGLLLYDVKDLNVSYDGKKLIFSMRAPDIENADDEDQPKWNIWEYAHETSELRRIFDASQNVTAEDGHDISPSYLSDGRIVFTSTRQSRSKAILLDEGKPQFSALDESRNVEAFNLHVMDADGQNIQQITFNQSHDLNPIVLENGKILFSRWDDAGRTRNNGLNLYQINPDGSGLSYMYGRHSHDSGDEGADVQYLKPREIDNGNVVVQLRGFQSENLASQPTEININEFVESDRMVDGTAGDDLAEQGQSAIVSGLNSSGEQTLNGRYGSFFPLYDGTNRYLVSWSLCRVALTDVNVGEEGNQPGSPESCTAEKLASDEYFAADPLYGLWILDVSNNTQLPIESSEEAQVFDEVVLLANRPEPTYISPIDSSELATKGYGVIHIKSVYDFDGVDTSPAGLAVLSDPNQTTSVNRPQRFIRIEKAVSMPSNDIRRFNNTAFGASRNQSMREILGYTPIEPDGSVKVAVPANVAFAISVLDENGRRTSERHQNWIHVAPGETLECIGCHTDDSEVPHGRADAEPDAINTGAVTTGLPFPNTDPALFADMGETMADTYARINGIRRLTADIVYADDWTDPAETPEADFTYAYSDLQSTLPVSGGCDTEWHSLCRITINYQAHIHPLWSVDRRTFETDPVTLEETLVEDRTCTSCHTEDKVLDDPLVATTAIIQAAQLDLTDGPGTQDLQNGDTISTVDRPDHYKSYRELLFRDAEKELVDNQFSNIEIDSGIPLVDEEGEPRLDAEGNIQNRFDLVFLPATMSVNGALQSDDFLDLFMAGGSHSGDLSLAELKLISEWLDIGAQYFNDPFKAPAN